MTPLRNTFVYGEKNLRPDLGAAANSLWSLFLGESFIPLIAHTRYKSTTAGEGGLESRERSMDCQRDREQKVEPLRQVAGSRQGKGNPLFAILYEASEISLIAKQPHLFELSIHLREQEIETTTTVREQTAPTARGE